MALGYAKPSFVYMDIGADHGLLSMALEESGHKVYAVENKSGPYSTLCSSLKEHHSSVSTLFSDGIDTMPFDVKGIFILGMGASTIQDILFRDVKKLNRLDHIIIEPQTDPSSLFKRLYDFGFYDELGCYVYERHYYPLLRFVRGKISYTDADLKYGSYPLRHNDPILKDKLVRELSVLESLKKRGVDVEEKRNRIMEAMEIWNLGN